MPGGVVRRIYVSGPMTGKRMLNFAAFDRARDALEADGWDVISPADHDRSIGADPLKLDRHKLMAWDIGRVLSCHAIHLLRGWERSEGACTELAVAKAIGLEVCWEHGALDPTHWSPVRADVVA